MSVSTLSITFSRNFCPQKRKFQGTNVPWNENSMELSSPRTKVPGDESSRERKFHPMELSSLGTKVLRDESSIIRQVECDGCVSNKLYSIKSILGYINLSHLNRRDAVIFRRFRIDHSRFSYSLICIFSIEKTNHDKCCTYASRMPSFQYCKTEILFLHNS